MHVRYQKVRCVKSRGSAPLTEPSHCQDKSDLTFSPQEEVLISVDYQLPYEKEHLFFFLKYFASKAQSHTLNPDEQMAFWSWI